MNKNLYVENSKKYKPLMLGVAIISYIIFIALIVVGLLYNFNIITDLPDAKYSFPGAILFLVVGIYSTWVLCSEYLKFYIIISDSEIKFYNNKRHEKFSVKDFTYYRVISKANWLMGGYWTIKLIFNGNNEFVVKSFKGEKLELVLKGLIK